MDGVFFCISLSWINQITCIVLDGGINFRYLHGFGHLSEFARWALLFFKIVGIDVDIPSHVEKESANGFSHESPSGHSRFRRKTMLLDIFRRGGRGGATGEKNTPCYVLLHVWTTHTEDNLHTTVHTAVHTRTTTGAPTNV